MPAKPQWLLYLPAIRGVLETLDFPVIDRAMVERLFGLRRRQAIKLLHRFGGFQAGRTFLIDRGKLIDALKEIEGGAEFAAEASRRQRLSDHLQEAERELKAKQVVIKVEPTARYPRVKCLGDGVVLEPGTLHIEFSDTEDLLSKLLHLSRAAAYDYEAFQTASEGAGQGNRRLLMD